MRKYYIFNINNEFFILNRDDAYDIYKQFEIINKLKKEEFYYATKIYETYANLINVDSLNNNLSKYYKNSYYYTKYKNNHMINNYYKDENSTLIVKKSYLLLETNYNKPSFFKNLVNNNYFACDFENKDYFWIDDFCNIT